MLVPVDVGGDGGCGGGDAAGVDELVPGADCWLHHWLYWEFSDAIGQCCPDRDLDCPSKTIGSPSEPLFRSLVPSVELSLPFDEIPTPNLDVAS